MDVSVIEAYMQANLTFDGGGVSLDAGNVNLTRPDGSSDFGVYWFSDGAAEYAAIYWDSSESVIQCSHDHGSTTPGWAVNTSNNLAVHSNMNSAYELYVAVDIYLTGTVTD